MGQNSRRCSRCCSIQEATNAIAMASTVCYNRCSKVCAGVCRCLQIVQRRRIINTVMKIQEVTARRELEDSASADLCKSSKSDEELGASNLSSCRSQGLRPRKSKKKHTIKGVRQGIDGQRIKGKKYGGPLPDYSE